LVQGKEDEINLFDLLQPISFTVSTSCFKWYNIIRHS
jgi:hypothetical protein